MLKPICCVLSAVAPLMISAGANAATVTPTLTRIADITSLAPDGSTLRTFNTPQIGGSTVIFSALSQNGLYALYSAPVSGGALVDLADSNTPVPKGTGTFTTSVYGAVSPFQAGGCAVGVVGPTSAFFVGNDSAQNLGIYSVPLSGGKVEKLANYNTLIPGGPVPSSGGITLFQKDYHFCNLSVSGTELTFDAIGGDGDGVYSIQTTSKVLSRVADANTPATATGPFTTVGLFFAPSIVGKQVVYVGSTTDGPYGIYKGGPKGDGAAVITTQSSEGNPYDQYANPTLGGSSILLAADLNGSENANVLVDVNLDGTKAKTIFNIQDSAVPKGALGSNFLGLGTDDYNYLGNDGYRLVFSATTYDAPPATYNFYDGVYSYCSGKLSKIIETGDTVGSAQIRAIGGISKLQRVKLDGVAADQFAALITLGPPATPSTYDGAAAIYVVTVPKC